MLKRLLLALVGVIGWTALAVAQTPSMPPSTITGVTAGAGLTGGGTVGVVTLTDSVTINPQLASTYTVVTGDRAKLITLSNLTGITVTLPQAGSTGFPTGWRAYIVNYGAGTSTVSPASGTIGQQGSLSMPAGTGLTVVSDGANWQVTALPSGAVPVPTVGTALYYIRINSGGTGYEALSPSATVQNLLSQIGSTTGDLLAYSGGSWNRLAAGTINFCLISGGAGVLPAWGSCTGGGGTVSSVTGTSNQVDAAPTTGAVILTLSSTLVAPGYVAVDGTSLPSNPGIYKKSSTALGIAAGSTYVGYWDANARVMLGDQIPATPQVIAAGGSTPFLQVHQSGNSGLGVFRWTNDTSPPSVRAFKSRGGTAGTYTAVQIGDTIARYSANAADGSSAANAANLDFLVDNTVSAGVVPTSFALALASATGVMTNRLTVSSAGVSVLTGTLSVSSTFSFNGTAASTMAYANNPTTTQGDFIYRNGANSFARLGVCGLFGVYSSDGSSPVCDTFSGWIDNNSSSTQGAMLTRNATDWVGLSPGTANTVLTSGGAGANLSYTAVVNSLAGTSNQITASGSTGAVTLTIPSAFIAPGYVAVAGSTIPPTGNPGFYEPAANTGAFASGGAKAGQFDSSLRWLFGDLALSAVPTSPGGGQGWLNVSVASQAALSAYRWSADTQGSAIRLAKSRGATQGIFTVVQTGDILGQVAVDGANGAGAFATGGNLRFESDTGTPGTASMPTRMVVSLAPDGSVTVAEGFRVSGALAVYFAGVGTTGSAANAFLDSGSTPANQLLRSTSSARYKRDIEPMGLGEAKRVLGLVPVNYHSMAKADDPKRTFVGLTAEGVAQVMPEYVNYDSEGRPDGVQYDRIGAVALLRVVQEQEQRLRELEARASNDNWSLIEWALRAVGWK